MKNKIACLIPVRSGSKRIKNKSTIIIKNKKPLLKFVCEKPIEARKINDFFIASDDKKYFNKLGILKNQ